MNKAITTLIMAAALTTAAPALHTSTAEAKVNITKSDIQLKSDLMTPEALWAMGRIGGVAASPDGKQVAYTVAYYSVKENTSHRVIYIMNADGSNNRQLTTSAESESEVAWLGNRLAFITGGQIWTMNADGSERKQLTNDKNGVEGFMFSPDGSKVVILKNLPYHGSIKENPEDLPKATGRLVTDLNYRHWDHYVEEIQHPFLAKVNADGTINTAAAIDILKDEPYECPMAPFGGIEQLAWSPDSKSVAYTCRKKEGVNYAISTDSDIYLYNTENGTTKNLCKPVGYKEPKIDATKSMQFQSVNAEKNLKNNPGYDTNPKFSPDGQYVAWLSMARNGYESDRNRLCVYNLADGTKNYVTEQFDSNVDDYCWSPDSHTLYYIGVWHACENMYQTDLTGNVQQLTEDWSDFGSLQMLGSAIDKKIGPQLVTTRHSFSVPDDIYLVTPSKKASKKNPNNYATVKQLTHENDNILSQLAPGKCQQRWVKTTDGKDMLVWVILPPHFDETKKYPTLLFCEGGPQSPVSQFWSYRWNFQIMAAQGYIIVAPNRRGLPGFGSKWCEDISGDWTGQCMNDYLSAIDDACTLPYVDKDRLGCVGASFGGFSVYYLAGHHDKRFKAFISHDGAFNLESMYTDTEEAWFSNWEYDDAYWNKDQSPRARKTYENSPHKFVDKWDTPILCIHGEMDYRINANQGFGAFNAARLRGIDAQLLIFPDENHWVLKPQNGILWQRSFFNFLDKYLK